MGARGAFTGFPFKSLSSSRRQQGYLRRAHGGRVAAAGQGAPGSDPAATQRAL